MDIAYSQEIIYRSYFHNNNKQRLIICWTSYCTIILVLYNITLFLYSYFYYIQLLLLLYIIITVAFR